MDKILIVDDDRIFLDNLTEGLQNYMGQFEVLTASSGGEALHILDTERISIVITALEMPEMDGLQLLSYLEKSRPQIPCILMQTSGGREIQNGIHRKNVFRMLVKPFDVDELFSAVMEGLERLDEGIFWREYRRC